MYNFFCIYTTADFENKKQIHGIDMLHTIILFLINTRSSII